MRLRQTTQREAMVYHSNSQSAGTQHPQSKPRKQTRHTLQYFTGDRMLALSLTAKRCFDRDSRGRVRHIWAQLAEETFRFCYKCL